MDRSGRLSAFFIALSLVASLMVSVTPALGAEVTLVVGYVSAGAPVKDARITVFDADGDRLDANARSDRNGYFVLRLPGSPNKIEVVATGGRFRGDRVDGSLSALHRAPSLDNNVYLNPVTTLINVYGKERPSLTQSAVARRVRGLLGLSRHDPLGRHLRLRPDYFDGVRFMERAERNGGLDSYVEKLVGKVDSDAGPIHFRPALASVTHGQRSVKQAAGFVATYGPILSTAASAVSIVSGIGSVVNDIIGWAQGPQATNNQIYQAVQDIESKLNTMSEDLASLESDVQQDFTQLKADTDEATYDQQVAPIQVYAGLIDHLEEDYEDLVNNATSPNFSQKTATDKYNQISDDIDTLETQFNTGNDLLRDALIEGGLAAKPVYAYLSEMLLSQNASFMTPTSSTRLTNLAEYVLKYQVTAFHLIMRWETNESPDEANVTLQGAINLYLGDAAKSWYDSLPADSAPTTAPSSGDLHDELTYLQTIDAVPANTVVDSNPGGVMWQSENAPYIVFAAYVPPGTGCGYLTDSGIGGSPTGGNYAECGTLQNGINAAEATMEAAKGTTGTGLTGWTHASATQATELFNIANVGDVINVHSYWWIPYDMNFESRDYASYEDGSGPCDVNNDDDCDYYESTIDQWDITFIQTYPTATITCSVGVGAAPDTTNGCAGYVLFYRTPRASEKYWP